jgi:ABC-type spermidine/putrescine transport system permease subunit I
MVHKVLVAATAAACSAVISVPVASADATLTFPNGNATCIAQAWVPFNTDPTVRAGSLGAFMSTGIARNGGLRQNGERGNC